VSGHRLLVKWLTPTTFVRVRNGSLQHLHSTCFAEMWDVGSGHALQARC
jgi:hypothetical protein